MAMSLIMFPEHVRATLGELSVPDIFVALLLLRGIRF